MSFKKILENYVAALAEEVSKAEKTGQHTDELSYRPVLHSLLTEISTFISNEIDIIHEPKNIGKAGRPDWRFSNSKTQGIYGYIESKGVHLDTAISLSEHSTQVNKYANLGHNLILTDGLDFAFYLVGDAEPKIVSIVEKPIKRQDLKKSEVNTDLLSMFKKFFVDEKPRQCSEDEIIFEAAKRAKLLSSNIEELSGLSPDEAKTPEEKLSIESISKIKTLLEEHHDPSLKDEKVFADFVAQVLIFGLIYAHRVAVSQGDEPRLKFQEMTGFWSDVKYKNHYEKIKPFKALLDILSGDLNAKSLSDLSVWYNDCKLFLSYISLKKEQKEAPDYHSLYEKFLSAFDAQQRFDYGAFYTPKELSQYTVHLVSAVYNNSFQGDLYAAGNKLIDPCCGTGSFLEELVKQAPKKAGADIVGFEILPAPYALAKYRMISLTRDNYTTENVSIVLTNTLSDALEKDIKISSALGALIQEEQSKARSLVKPPVILIIGNPPSSDSKVETHLRTEGKNFQIITKMIEDFRPPATKRTARQNIQKQTKNEFIKFLRWSSEKILKSHNGIMALILPSSFVEHESYLYARKWIADNFDSVWTLDLDDDARTGGATQSLFNTQQGRCLLIAVRSPSKTNLKPVNLFYNAISHLKKNEKLQFLLRGRSSIAQYLGEYSTLTLNDTDYSFRPHKDHDSDIWNKYWPVYPAGGEPTEGEPFIFSRFVSAVKMGATSLFVHVNQGLLKRRSKSIANPKLSYDQIKKEWYSGQDKPPPAKKFTQEVKKAFEKTDIEKSIVPYAYRPFLNLKALINDDLFNSLSEATGKSSGTRSRPELRQVFSAPDSFGIAITPGPKDVGSEIHRFSSFCWHLPDNDLCKRGNAKIFCKLFPEYKGANKDKWDNKLKNNISRDLIDSLTQAYETTVSYDQVVFYTYSILCSEKYLKSFEGVLFSVSGAANRPRIPFPSSRILFEELSNRGKELAVLEDFRIPLSLSEEYGHILQDFDADFLMINHDWDVKKQGLCDIFLRSDAKVEVVIPNVPQAVVEYMVSGYSVIGQWLKMYSFRYKRSKFSKEDLEQFLSLLVRVEMQIDIIKKNDEAFLALLSADNLLAAPT